jgi:hypothetical protein
LLRPLLNFISFMSFTLNLDLRWAGIPSDPFGSIMITNVGSLGLDVAYVPLVPYSRVPILLAVGAVKDKAIVEDGKIVPGKMMSVNATFDHRLIDGFHAASMSKVLRKYLEHPYENFDKLEGWADAKKAGTGEVKTLIGIGAEEADKVAEHKGEATEKAAETAAKEPEKEKVDPLG